MRKIPLSVISVLASVLILPGMTLAAETSTLNATLATYGVRIATEAGDLAIKRDFKQVARGTTYHSITAEGPGQRIEIEADRPIPPDKGVEFAKNKHAIIKGLYGDRVVPYAAMITRVTGAPEDKKPYEKKAMILGVERDILIANASDRYVLGVWDDNLIAQRAICASFYEPSSGTVFQILIFIPVKDFVEEKAVKILESLEKIQVIDIQNPEARIQNTEARSQKPAYRIQKPE
ncbi:MAG: hypothetical protein HQL30_08705 [Candidatus Omnitrophica bacterium]|nr:hypothetical protein [Candidatus Omnitrophota bacterium]